MTCQSSHGNLVHILLRLLCNFITHPSFTVLKRSETRKLIAAVGFILDVSDFMDDHLEGRALLAKNIRKNAMTTFFSGVYDHSNAAYSVRRLPTFLLIVRKPDMNITPQLLSMKRVSVLHGGQPHGNEELAIPASQKLRVAWYNEMGSPYISAI